MKQFLYFCALFFLLSCDDGNLPIEVLDFDAPSITVQNCGDLTTGTNIFFKINGDEVLILELQSGLLKNEVSDGTITSTVPGQSKVIYRIFSDNVTSNYFCDGIPVTEPTVKQEIESEGGEILITTVAKDSVSFDHTIELSGISLVTADGSRITDLTINNFGTVTTKP